ncbi:MAG: hypothetical protein JNM72_02850, partial [Deltaproteobacteria bacterium]|nr:hypothetical protein [Deltaproteobacteria bacterium]
AWALAARLALDPPVGAAPATTAALQAALARGPLWRLRLAEGALGLPTPPAGRLVEPLMRALIVDLDGPLAGSAVTALDGLRARAADGAAAALRADLPPLPKPPAPRAALPWEGARVVDLPASGGGAPVLDLLPLDHGGVVVALGGLGQRLLRPGARGRLLPTPAERLLALPGGWLALSQAGRDLRVGRGGEHCPIDELGLIPGAAGALLRARTTADGLLVLPEGPELCAYLPEAGGLRRLWRSGALPEGGSAWSIPAVDVEGNDLRAILEAPTGDRALWRWDRAAGLALRERRALRVDGRLRPPTTALLSGAHLYEGDGHHERLFVGPTELWSRPSPAEPADLEALGGPPAPKAWAPGALFGDLLLEREAEGRVPRPPAAWRLRRLSAPSHRSLQLRGPARCAALAGDQLWLGGGEGSVWRVDLHEAALVWQEAAG